MVCLKRFDELGILAQENVKTDVLKMQMMLSGFESSWEKSSTTLESHKNITLAGGQEYGTFRYAGMGTTRERGQRLSCCKGC
jgi:hypothetical protein